ncbi:MAG: NADP-binding protein [Bacillota bacterium]
MHEHDPIRVVHWGLDPVGLTAARLVWRRPGLMPVGAICRGVGKDLGDLMGLGERLGVTINNDPAAVLHTTAPDVTIISFDRPLTEVAPMVEQAMEAGSNVICLAGEMTYPWAVDPKLAERLDDMAYAHGVTVLGTGINPGFILDSLVIALTGCCLDVERIKASRVIGAGPGQVRGHVGFEQSIHLIADALGWPLERVEQEQAAGTHHAAHGYIDGRVRIILEQVEQVGGEAEGIATGDFIDIEGQPPVRLAIQPEIDEVKGAAALAVNMISAVLLSGPGLKSMAEMPLPRAVLGDLRQMADLKGLTVDEALARGWQGSSLERANSIHLREKGESAQG